MLSVAANPARTDAELMQWWTNGGEATLDATLDVYGLDFRSTSGSSGMDEVSATLREADSARESLTPEVTTWRALRPLFSAASVR